jgi:hypothetical protein
LSIFRQIGFSRISEVISLDQMGSSIFQEESLIHLTDWGWLILLIVVIFVVWLLIIFQVNSKGAHEWGQISESDESQKGDEHANTV